MAKATVCDRCGKVLKYACDCHIKIYVHPYGDQHYELCDACTQILRKWLSEKGRESNGRS